MEKLFKEKVVSMFGLEVHHKRADLPLQGVLYSEGYKIAADSLVEAMINNPENIIAFDFLTHNEYDSEMKELFVHAPIIFLYRQYIELKLKQISLFDSNELNNEGESLTGNKLTLNHDLDAQWGIARKAIEEKIVDKGRKFYGWLDTVGEYIKEFNSIDGDSYRFRYPYNKGVNGKIGVSPYFSDTDTVIFDLLHLKNGMNNLYEMLEKISISLRMAVT